MIVRCINDNFKPVHEIAIKTLEAIRIVGDDHLIPKVGCEYEVIGYLHDEENDVEAYLFAEIDTSAYGCRLHFLKEHFEVSDDTFVSNTYMMTDFYEGPAREVSLHIRKKIVK